MVCMKHKHGRLHLTRAALTGLGMADLAEMDALLLPRDPSWSPAQVEAHPLDLGGPWAYILDHVLTPVECLRLINATEARGYEMAQVNVGYGRQRLMPEIRNNDRCIVDSLPDADLLWDRIRAWIPATFQGFPVAGLNERLRFLRYTRGQRFAPHLDGTYAREDGSAFSLITVQLYLNDVEPAMGGSTRFFLEASDAPTKLLDVVPRAGRVLLFEHRILHEGAALAGGIKYACRTDVMYSSCPPTFPAPK